MKKKVTILVSIVAILAAIFACERKGVPVVEVIDDPIDTSDNTVVLTDTLFVTDTLYIDTSSVPMMPCSPDTVYFEQQILPLLQSQCASPDCHDQITHEENVYMTSYERILTTGGINLSSPTNSDIYKSLNANGNNRMPPPPRSPLTADQKALILKWIQQGAKNLHCDVACDTTVFTFNAVVKPIVSQRCVGCHGNTSPSGNIKLVTYADIKASVDSGDFYGSIVHAVGVKPMPYPQGAAKMPDCEIIKIRKWIEAGALEN